MMDERIDAFLKDLQEPEGVSLTTIRDGVRHWKLVLNVMDSASGPSLQS